MAKQPLFHLHEDAPLFNEAVVFTAAETRFAPRLIEKDYFCSLVLQHLCEAAPELHFKGGTCLAKVHLGFYRLSEDLDFGIPMPVTATRTVRRQSVIQLKKVVERIGKDFDGLRVLKPLTGANDSRQYEATIGYPSRLHAGEDTVSVEISLREPLLTDVFQGSAMTLLLDPVSGSAFVPPLPIPCLSREEAMAEKLRAALSRHEPAIRDFYDIDHAVRRVGFDVQDANVIRLLKTKLAVPGNAAVDTSPARLEILRSQLESRLRPVLREQEFREFDLDRAFGVVAQAGDAVGQGRAPA